MRRSLRPTFCLLRPTPPHPVPPRRKRVTDATEIGHRIISTAPPRMAAAEPRNHQPESLPRAVFINCFERVFRTRRQMPALHANERLQRPAIDVNGEFDQRLCRGMAGFALQGHGSEQILELSTGYSAITEYSCKEPWADRFTCVSRHNGLAAVGMGQPMVTSLNSNHTETRSLQRSDEFPTRKHMTRVHTATVTSSTPTNSRFKGASAASSRHASIASRTRSISSSRVLA